MNIETRNLIIKVAVVTVVSVAAANVTRAALVVGARRLAKKLEKNSTES